MTARVLAVAGASGGLGTSTLACAIARRATTSGLSPSPPRVALVDLHLGGGGLDVTACAEHRPGLRWSDLLDVDGSVDGASLLARLPTPDGLPILAARGVPPPGTVVAAVLQGVLEASDLLVLDAAPDTVAELAEAGRELMSGFDALLLTGLGARHLADAEAARRALDEAPHVHLVTRGPRASDVSEAVAAHLDLPLLGHLPDDPRVVVDAHRGVPPGERSGAGPSRMADLAIEATGGVWGARAAGPGVADWPPTVLAS